MTRRRWIADEVSGNRATLTGQNARHLARVLRARVGQEFDIACDHSVRLGRITSIEDDRVEFELGEETTPAAEAEISLLLAIFKFDRLEWAIEKATELGVRRILPVIAQRTDAHLATAAAKRVERWRKIAHEAAQQSRRTVEPEIDPAVKLKAALAQIPDSTTRIVLAETEKSVTLAEVIAGKPEPIILAIGPEGGWTADELELFKNSGWVSASLGSTILRAETAAIAALAVVSALKYAAICSQRNFSLPQSGNSQIIRIPNGIPLVSHSPTSEQREAIEHLNGPMLVVAGAGSGKTTVLARRIANLIQNHKVAPEEILAVTYTDNAAKNLRERVQQYLGKDLDSSGLQTRTFHSYCAELLNRHGRAFKVVEKIDLQVYLNLYVADLPLKNFIKAASPGQFIGDLLEFNTRCQDDLITVEDYQNYVAGLEANNKLPLPRVAPAKDMAEMPREEVLARCKEIAAVYSYVNILLREKNWGTFGEMIVDAISLLRDTAILEKERKRTRFILIDEFQDSNFGQIELAQLLAGDAQNIFAVGDPDQAIYRFRGATSEAFEEFKRRFPGARTLTLQHNFRSVPAVLKTAFEVISKNDSPERKPLISGRAEKAKVENKQLPDFPPQVVVTPDFQTEAKTVVDSIADFKRQTAASWSDFAVLYRQHGHREELIAECVERMIPHDVKGVNVIGAPDVRDLIALIRVIAIPDDSVSWFRAAALPSFQIDAVALKSALNSARRDSSLQAVLHAVPGGKKLLDCFTRSRQQIMSMKLAAHPAIELLIKNFALSQSPQLRAFAAFAKDWQDKPIVETKSLDEFCEYLNCFIDLNGKICLPDQPDQDAVQLMTVHGAKGLEFAHVSVIRVNQSAFPTSNHEPLFEFPQELSRSKIRALPSGKEMHEQEERRLFYVAVTRAKDSLGIYGKPRGKGGPSGYLKELLANKQLSSVVNSRTVEALRIDVQASAAPVTQIGGWLTMPSPTLRSQLTLSASAIDSYDTCPLKYKIEREWKLPGELSASQQFGSAIHSVLRDYFESVKAGKVLGLETVLDIFRNAIREAKIQDQLQLQLYTEQGIRQLTAFVQSRAEQPQPIVLATEKAFDFELGGIRLKGRIDRMDLLSENEVAIEDYKAGSAKNEKHADESMQLTVYALAARHEGKTAEKLSFYSLENNSTVFTERSEEELAEAEEKISEIADGIRSGNFDPKPGFHCSWCAYSSICPTKEEKLFQISKAAGSIQ